MWLWPAYCRRGGSKEGVGLLSWKKDKTVIISLWRGMTAIILQLCSVQHAYLWNKWALPQESTLQHWAWGLVALLSFFLSFSHMFSFPLLKHLFNILIHSTCNYFKNKFSADKKNWASWVTQMTSLFLLEDKVFIRSLVGLLQEVSEFE